MSWLRSFWDCFRCENEDDEAGVFRQNSSLELCHPTNVAVLRQPTSGCQGVFIIHDDGRVQMSQENDQDQQAVCTPSTPESSPAGDSVHTPQSMIIPEMTDEDFLEGNQRKFWAQYGATLKDRLPPASPSPNSIEDTVSNTNETLLNVASPTGGELEENTDGEMFMGAAAEPVTSNDTCSLPQKPPRGSILPPTAQLLEDRPKLTASRTKSKPAEANCSANTSGTNNVPKIQVPSLLDNPNEFWMLFHALAHQLGTYYKKSPNVLRPFHWETDGCICRYLFPPLTPEQKSDLFTRYTLQRFPPDPTPIVIRQLPLPQKAVLE